jgi:hypothetical protein
MPPASLPKKGSTGPSADRTYGAQQAGARTGAVGGRRVAAPAGPRAAPPGRQAPFAHTHENRSAPCPAVPPPPSCPHLVCQLEVALHHAGAAGGQLHSPEEQHRRVLGAAGRGGGGASAGAASGGRSARMPWGGARTQAAAVAPGPRPPARRSGLWGLPPPRWARGWSWGSAAATATAAAWRARCRRRWRRGPGRHRCRPRRCCRRRRTTAPRTAAPSSRPARKSHR